MQLKTVMASSWLAQWFIRTTQLADVICFGGKLIMSTVVTQTLFFYVLVKQVCLPNSNQSYWQDLVCFSLASGKIQLVSQFYFEINVTYFINRFLFEVLGKMYCKEEGIAKCETKNSWKLLISVVFCRLDIT